jgi:hypothetical protein
MWISFKVNLSLLGIYDYVYLELIYRKTTCLKPFFERSGRAVNHKKIEKIYRFGRMDLLIWLGSDRKNIGN